LGGRISFPLNSAYLIILKFLYYYYTKNISGI
jgi:hypothetical protein